MEAAQPQHQEQEPRERAAQVLDPSVETKNITTTIQTIYFFLVKKTYNIYLQGNYNYASLMGASIGKKGSG